MAARTCLIDWKCADRTRAARPGWEGEMSTTAANWIVVLSCAYMEYSTWRGMSVYRRTVDYDNVVWC
ncbi:hypothetical protein GCM10009079_21100 [Ralstonia mannitolilytica]